MIPCSAENCENLGRWVPGLMLSAFRRNMGNPCRCARVIIPLPHCDDCRREVEATGVSALMTDEGFCSIQRSLAANGRAIPQKQFTVIRWLELPVEMEFEAGALNQPEILTRLNDLADSGGIWRCRSRRPH